MGTRLFSLVTTLCFLTIFCQGQVNLVNNPSFESYTTCPFGWSQLNYCNDWVTPSGHVGSSDYDNACCINGISGVPVNAYGTQPAFHGDAYAGIIVKVSGTSGREYLMGSLSSPLVAGSPYVVSAQICHAQNSQNSTSDFGIFLSPAAPIMAPAGQGALGVTPQVSNPSTNFLSVNNWVTISDTIIAAGGEQFITIGSFDPTPSVMPTGTTTGWGHVYYYVDLVDVHLLQGVYGDTIVCEGDTANLYSTQDPNTNWFLSSNLNNSIAIGDSISVTPLTTTSYTAITALDTIEITVQVLNLPAQFVGNDVTVCEGEQVTRTANLSGIYSSYLWSNGQTTPTMTTYDSGFHSLTIDTLGCTANDTFHISFHPFPSFTLGPDTSICHYDNIWLGTGLPTVGFQFNWNTGSTLPAIQTGTAGTYTLTVSDVNCTYSDTIIVSVLPELEVDLGPDQFFCYENSVTINSTTANATGFQWSTGATTSDIFVTTSGTYTLTVTDGSCFAEDMVHYDLYFLPSVNLGPDDKFCPGEALTLDANQPTGINVLWSNGKTTGDILVKDVGLYWVQVSDGFCSMRDSIVIDQHTPILVDLGDDIQTCKGETTILEVATSEPVSGYAWNDGSADSILVISSGGHYAVTVNNGICSASDNVNIFEYQYPALNLGSDTAICPDVEFWIDTKLSPNIINYNWFDGEKAPARFVWANMSDGPIWVRATNVVCSSTDTIHITELPVPTVDLGKDTSICANIPFTLSPDSTKYDSYQWSTGSTAPSIDVTDVGAYLVTVSNGKCESKDSIYIHHKAVPTALDLDAPSEICYGDQIVLNAYDDLFDRYEWYDETTVESVTIDTEGTYWVKAYHVCGVETDTVSLERCECDIYVPSAFTPGNNKINDEFLISVDCRFTEINLRVFDRWGEIVFETADITRPWNAVYLGREVPMGTYGWQVVLKGVENGNPIEISRSGTVAVMR